MIDGTVLLLAPSVAGFGLVLRAMRRDRLEHAAATRNRTGAPSPAQTVQAPAEPQAAPALTLVAREAA